MKEIRRSRRPCLPRRRRQSVKPITTDDDESDLEHQIFHQKTIAPGCHKNANRTATTLFDPVITLPIEEKKQHLPLQSSSDQSSLYLYSINSIQKPTAISDDLTPLTITTTDTTPLTDLTSSKTKQTETVKIDLTELSGTDTLDSSPTNSNHDQSLSRDQQISSSNIDYKIENTKDLTQIYDTDTSIRSVAFSKDNSSEQELSYHKHVSCFTIPGVGNGDCMTITSPSLMEDVQLPATTNTNVNICQRLPPIRWNLQNMKGKLKFLIGCSSLSLIAGIVILVIIL